MPKVLAGTTYFLAHEAARAAGISKATLLRWIGQKTVKDAQMRDRNGWRLFTAAEVETIVRAARGDK